MIATKFGFTLDPETGVCNRQTETHDWKRRGERLVRASGLPYTIVRPGWFDYNKADEHQMVFLQGDRRHAGDPSDGVIASRQLAQILVASLTSEAALDADPPGGPDAVGDLANMPLAREPQRVRDDLDAVTRRTQEN